MATENGLGGPFLLQKLVWGDRFFCQFRFAGQILGKTQLGVTGHENTIIKCFECLFFCHNPGPIQEAHKLWYHSPSFLHSTFQVLDVLEVEPCWLHLLTRCGPEGVTFASIKHWLAGYSLFSFIQRIQVFKSSHQLQSVSSCCLLIEELLLDSSRVLLTLFVGEGSVGVASLELGLADSLVVV